MELPKNITQIGEADDKCKIYVEDYVVSYMRQMNQVAREKEMALALYGTCTDEEDKSYVFIYGAARVNYLQKEVRHLSQAQKQEIEGNRVRYFKEYSFQGYCLLKGEMIEGFYICSQDICRFTKGYAQFYEKNEGMLAYMLEMRQEEPVAEVVNQEKYEQVKKRQEERKSLFGLEQEKKLTLPKVGGFFPKDRFKNLQFSVVASFAILCVLGLLAITGGQQNLLENESEEENPSVQEVAGSAVQSEVLTAQDGLLEALQEENKGGVENGLENPETGMVQEDLQGKSASSTDASEAESSEQVSEENIQDGQSGIENIAGGSVPEENNLPEETLTSQENQGDLMPEEVDGSSVPTGEIQPVNAQPVVEAVPEQLQFQTYVIQKGDTLNRISLRYYGTKGYVNKICELNGIENPDRIKMGEKILLP